MNWQDLALTAKLAGIVCAMLLLIGMPVAYWVAYSRWRWKFLVESVVAIGSRSPLGRLYETWFGHSLAFTFEGLVVASVLYSLPFAVQPMAAAFAQVDRRLLDASSILGASRMHTFLRIILPLSIPGVITAAVLTFAHTLGEFGVVLMVGGNIPGATRTVSIAIYDDVQGLRYLQANQTALALVLFSFLALSILYGVNRRAWTAWPPR